MGSGPGQREQATEEGLRAAYHQDISLTFCLFLGLLIESREETSLS